MLSIIIFKAYLYKNILVWPVLHTYLNDQRINGPVNSHLIWYRHKFRLVANIDLALKYVKVKPVSSFEHTMKAGIHNSTHMGMAAIFVM